MMKMSLNKKGIGTLAFVTGISVASVVVVAAVSQLGLDTFRRSAYSYSEWETNLVNQQGLSLGGFFVAHNLVLCREGGWKDLGPEKKCRWGGNYQKPNKISMGRFGVKKEEYIDNALVLTLTFKDADNVETKLTLDLVNWTENEQLRDLVGKVSIDSAFADDDRFMVLMTASTELALADKRTKIIQKSGAVRRPLGTPNLIVVSNSGKEACIFECEAGNTLTPYPECRGPLDSPPEGGDAAVGIRLTNYGPGAIYKLAYDRTTQYNKSVYPTKGDDLTLVDVLNQDEVFMPGDERESELVRKCYRPTTTFMTQTIEQVVTGTVDSESTATTVSVASSVRNLSTEAFKIVTSKFDPRKVTDLNNFKATYDPYNPATYVANESLSHIEPKRLGSALQNIEVGSVEENVTQTTTVVRTREVMAVSSDGDGDGIGDGDN